MIEAYNNSFGDEYTINPKYYDLWKDNKLFIQIKSKAEFDILDKFRINNTSYHEKYYFYCFKGFSDLPNKKDTLKRWNNMEIITFSEFFNKKKEYDVINHINEIKGIYYKKTNKNEL